MTTRIVFLTLTRVATLTFLCILLPSPATAMRAWVVGPDGMGDAPTIQAAMDSAQAGDAVVLEGGTYYEHDIELKSEVLLTSITGLADCAVIDAGGDGGGMSGVDLGPDTRIVGITLTHGVATCRDDGYGNLECLGGGMFLLRATLTIVNCVFADNITSMGPSQANGAGGGRGLGGGVYAQTWSGGPNECSIDNCTFSANYAELSAAGILWYSNSPVLYVSRTIIAFSTRGNALGCFWTGGATFECCDIYGNAGGDWVGGLEGQADVNGNFSLDPRFCAEESDNLALMQCSPCAPGNHPDGANCRQIGALPVACPGTAVEPTTWGRIKTIFR